MAGKYNTPPPPPPPPISMPPPPPPPTTNTSNEPLSDPSIEATHPSVAILGPKCI
jgi:hypothetical protein